MSRLLRTLVSLGVLAQVSAAAPFCSLDGYKARPGLEAANDASGLTITWEGEKNKEIRLRLTIDNRTPTIRDLAMRAKNGMWTTIAANVVPEFRVVSALRRIENEQLEPLRRLGIAITPEIVSQYKWDAFWDAPLMIPGTEMGGYMNDRPPKDGIAGQPGLPRKPEEVQKADASYDAQSCEAKTDGARLEITFPGVQLGVFKGRLVYTVYKGTSLIRQEIVAMTQQDSVAYKYEAGLKGFAIQQGSRIAWRSTANTPQSYSFEAPVNDAPVTVQAANRLVVTEGKGGSIAAFPPPHNFFWSRELDVNLGYDWYSKDTDSSFSFGVREADSEAPQTWVGRGPTDYRENFALRSARPGTWQHMPVYFIVSDGPAGSAFDSALAYTRGDHYKEVAGYKVMATHFHSGITKRLIESGNLDNMLPDFQVVKDAGINIFAPIDGDNASGTGVAIRGAGHVKNQAAYYEVARLHSSKDFVVMPNEEIMSGEVAALGRLIGGHTDLLVSHPVYWAPTRKEGQPLSEDDPVYGKVYHIGTPEDLEEMMHREDLIVYMPHPRSKGSTGYPDAIKDRAYFIDESYRGIGFRWGMGIDGSEQRLCEIRCLPTLDDMNNWVADLPTPPKYVQAISEVYEQGMGDDIYANNPVNYVKLDALPGRDNWKPIVDSMRRGDYFVTSGEVLIPNYSVQGTGNQRKIVADVEWTFPLEFVEVVWGDGKTTDRQIIPATDLPAFGKKHFEIPFNGEGKKWVRFAVWDSAGDGALVQPIKLPAANNNYQAMERTN